MFKRLLALLGLTNKASKVSEAPKKASPAPSKPKTISSSTAHSRPKKAKGGAKKGKKAVRRRVRRKPSKRGRLS